MIDKMLEKMSKREALKKSEDQLEEKKWKRAVPEKAKRQTGQGG